MNMRVNTIITHLRAEDALTLIEFLEQLRDVLAQCNFPRTKRTISEISAHLTSASPRPAMTRIWQT